MKDHEVTSEYASHLAAQCWCDPETEHLNMDSDLAKAFAKRLDNLIDGLESAWGLIANSYGGDWELANPDWRLAAERWREEYWHKVVCHKFTDSTIDEPEDV